MRIGIFADAHDHVDHVRQAVSLFNVERCDLVVFAGDFCSPIVIPPLRHLGCPVLACFGDNDANRVAIEGGLRIVGVVGEPPFGFSTPDGVRVLVTHELEDLRGLLDGADVVITAHNHKASVRRDDAGRWFVNPGETSGWTYREPSVAILDTAPLAARIVRLSDMPPKPEIVRVDGKT